MNKKIINNAISAYFGLGVLLLFPSKKENINNAFVKNHSKTALFIHILMFINYLIFISFSFLGNISFFSFYLNHIIASIIFIFLFGGILYGVSKANSGNDFSIKDISIIIKTEKFYEIKSSKLSEEGILTIVLSLIPFLGFIIKGKFINYKSSIIENNTKLNFIITLFITFLFLMGYKSIGLIFILLYIIFIVFFSILLIINKNLITLNLSKIPTFEELYIYTKTLIFYLKKYFSKKCFTNLGILLKNTKIQYISQNQTEKIILQNLEQPKIAHKIAYIPYINIISLIDIRSNYKNHIINGLIITIISIIMIFILPKSYQIFILFLIFFGIGYQKNIEYKLPFLFDIYLFFKFVFLKINFIQKKVREKQKEVKEVSFKREI